MKRKLRFAMAFLALAAMLMAPLSSALADQFRLMPGGPLYECVSPAVKSNGISDAQPNDDSTDLPKLTCNQKEVEINEKFYLKWNEPDAELVNLWRRAEGEDYKYLGDVEKTNNRYEQSIASIGQYYYCLGVLKNSSWEFSPEVLVTVTADDDTVCAELQKRGMTNKWNLMFMVYRTVKIGGFKRSFTDEQMAALQTQISKIKYTMEGLSEGRMRIGTVDTVIIDDPVTSASDTGWSPPNLVLGAEGDVDFFYIMDHKDINLAAIFVPLQGMSQSSNWLGLGGTYNVINGKRLYTVIINDVYTYDNTWSYKGKSYLLTNCALVHEMLHAVETNSSSNSWRKYQPLHDAEKNDYYDDGDGYLLWYHDLMCDTLANGKHGFRPQSYYVRHHSIPAGMKDGPYTDYDGIFRYYISGVPHIIRLFLPANLKTLTADAFAGIKGSSVLIPSSVISIDDDAFDHSMTVYGYEGSEAQAWAEREGYTFIKLKK